MRVVACFPLCALFPSCLSSVNPGIAACKMLTNSLVPITLVTGRVHVLIERTLLMLFASCLSSVEVRMSRPLLHCKKTERLTRREGHQRPLYLKGRNG